MSMVTLLSFGYVISNTSICLATRRLVRVRTKPNLIG